MIISKMGFQKGFNMGLAGFCCGLHSGKIKDNCVISRPFGTIPIKCSPSILWESLRSLWFGDYSGAFVLDYILNIVLGDYLGAFVFIFQISSLNMFSGLEYFHL